MIVFGNIDLRHYPTKLHIAGKSAHCGQKRTLRTKAHIADAKKAHIADANIDLRHYPTVKEKRERGADFDSR